MISSHPPFAQPRAHASPTRGPGPGLFFTSVRQPAFASPRAHDSRPWARAFFLSVCQPAFASPRAHDSIRLAALSPGFFFNPPFASPRAHDYPTRGPGPGLFSKCQPTAFRSTAGPWLAWAFFLSVGQPPFALPRAHDSIRLAAPIDGSPKIQSMGESPRKPPIDRVRRFSRWGNRRANRQ